MKKYIILFIVLPGILASCKKSWLEIVPQGRQLAITTDDYDKLLNDPKYYIFQAWGGYAEAQLMGDEISAEEKDFANLDANYDFRDRFFEWRDDPFPNAAQKPGSMLSYLSQQYQLNKIILEVDKSSGGSTAQKNSIKAEAQATRAFNLFLIANYYCKPYSAATAASDPGFPMTLEADITANNFNRGTLQQTYDFIVKELTDALTVVPMKQGFVSRLSKPAVEGVLGKVYMFMGRYADALPQLKNALADVIANGQTALYNYNQTMATGGAFMPIDATTGASKAPSYIMLDTKESVLYKVGKNGNYAGNGTGNNGLVLTPQTWALYGAKDFRKLFYSATFLDNSTNPSGRVRKYGLAYTRFGLELADLYLLSAECKARTNDLTGAVADVETLRKNRMPAADATVPAAIAGDQNALIKFIIEERLREFALEGYRWFDMRRLSVDPLFSGAPAATHILYKTNGTTTVYTLTPQRLTMRFPRYITEDNPEMPDNP